MQNLYDLSVTHTNEIYFYAELLYNIFMPIHIFNIYFYANTSVHSNATQLLIHYNMATSQFDANIE